MKVAHRKDFYVVVRLRGAVNGERGTLFGKSKFSKRDSRKGFDKSKKYTISDNLNGKYREKKKKRSESNLNALSIVEKRIKI